MRRPAPVFTGALPRRESGFTLVEMMVVITIIALASAAVALSLPGGRGEARRDGQALAARLVAARNAAIVESRDSRVRVDAGGFVLEQRRGGEWRAVAGKAGQMRRWSPGVSVAGDPQFVFDTTGSALPAAVTVTGGDLQLRVSTGADGAVRVEG